MAKPAAAARPRRKERKNIIAGVAHVAATFNNTVITITDAQGNAILQPGYVRTRYTYVFNFSRNPTLSLPCGFDSNGLPISLQFIGRHFEEATLLRVGYAYEQATTWHTQIPTLLQG